MSGDRQYNVAAPEVWLRLLRETADDPDHDAAANLASAAFIIDDARGLVGDDFAAMLLAELATTHPDLVKQLTPPDGAQ